MFVGNLTEYLKALSAVPGQFQDFYSSHRITDFSEFADSQFHIEFRLKLIVTPLKASFRTGWAGLRKTRQSQWAVDAVKSDLFGAIGFIESSNPSVEILAHDDSVDRLLLQVRYLDLVQSLLV